MKTEKSGINNAPYRPAAPDCANAPARPWQGSSVGKSRLQTVSNKIKFPSKNAVALWFLSAFAIELIAFAALAVIR
jgi:hypothetical protein